MKSSLSIADRWVLRCALQRLDRAQRAAIERPLQRLRSDSSDATAGNVSITVTRDSQRRPLLATITASGSGMLRGRTVTHTVYGISEVEELVSYGVSGGLERLNVITGPRV